MHGLEESMMDVEICHAEAPIVISDALEFHTMFGGLTAHGYRTGPGMMGSHSGA